jgi:hypothetical protein
MSRSTFARLAVVFVAVNVIVAVLVVVTGGYTLRLFVLRLSSHHPFRHFAIAAIGMCHVSPGRTRSTPMDDICTRAPGPRRWSVGRTAGLCGARRWCSPRHLLRLRR